MKKTVNILISTIDSGIHNLDNVILEPRDDLSYILVHQYTSEEYKSVPSFLNREDIRISQIKGRGVTRSRNLAIELSDGDIGLFADDDVTYQPGYFDTLIRVFEENPDLDVALFKIKTGPDEPEYKDYPDQIRSIQQAPAVGTVEIGFRINRIKEKEIFFDERFGAGQPLLIGSDERLFVQDCINSGLTVTYFPEYIVNHPFESSVKKLKKYDKRLIWVTGGVDCRLNGPVALLKAFLGTIKHAP
ncbi:MAG: glycosyltransferase family A protein, partial [Balneolaceae bacterium]|nr:glycosyltransferase family A protein [Balneolaceae bacterium]